MKRGNVIDFLLTSALSFSEIALQKIAKINAHMHF
jgi:hypothetical protein